MKNKIFIIFLFLTNFIYCQKFSVVDYYKILPDSLRKGYQLFFKNNKWITYSSEGYEIMPVVDIKNGYINIDDPGTGGGESTLTVALFRKNDGSALIGVSYYTNDGIYANSWVYFLEYNNNKWEIVNQKVLPSITYKNFMSENYIIPKFPYPPYVIHYSLPQFGTTIELLFKCDYVVNLCSGIISTEDKKLIQNACNFVDNIKHHILHLAWDKLNNKFYFK